MTIDERLTSAGLPPLPRRLWLEIDLDALANNVAVFRELVGPHVELSAVVKADAYGHGLVPVARAFEDARVDRLCVASIDEAIALRDGGIEAPILILFSIPAGRIAEAAQLGLDISVGDDGEVLAALDGRAAAHGSHDVNVQVEIETGLTRAGIKPDDAARIVQRAQNSRRGPSPAGVWSHIASPEDPVATATQVREFERALDVARGGWVPARHIAATGALLAGGVPFYEGVRVGLGLYGLVPATVPIAVERRSVAERLRPAMALKAMPLRVETFPKETPVGYGGTWVAARESVIATLPVGYGDGFARAYSPGAQALVRGSRAPVVGTVAMDALMVDVTEIEGVGLDDEFVLLGRQGDQEITTNELSRLRNTIPWEVVTSMSFRVPRVYHAGSVLMGLRTLDGDLAARAEAVG